MCFRSQEIIVMDTQLWNVSDCLNALHHIKFRALTIFILVAATVRLGHIGG